MELLFVYTTFPSQEVAHQISRSIIAEGLAACVNCLGNVWSCYTWDQKLSEVTETACIFKTTRAAYPMLEKRIVDLHPYDTPCVVGLPIHCGEATFLQWLAEATTKK